VRFTLTYDGPLLTKEGKAGKQKVREHFHPQLQELWGYEPLKNGADMITEHGWDPGGLSILTTREGQVYAPLASKKLKVSAELDVLLLRGGPAGGVIVGQGDIDNRLKVLFDALSVPPPQQGVPCTDGLGTPQAPLHTLVEDDDMITRVNVVTARWLGSHPPNEVRVIIHADVRPAGHIYANQLFL